MSYLLRACLTLVILYSLGSCSSTQRIQSYSPKDKPQECNLPASEGSSGDYYAPKTQGAITIDGLGTEESWSKAMWKDIKYRWLGPEYSPQDFQGRYKITWDENQIYYLVEIVDNVISDQHKDPFDNWWEDDCLELFIDEDASKGNHQYTHNAFAYHITLDYDVVDLGADHKPHLYNKDIQVKRTKKGNLYTWEVAMKVFPDSYKEDAQNVPVKLFKGKKMGFAVSYNDNDGTGVRENFIGSIDIKGEDKNQGWIDAGVFGKLELIE